ncbi:MAG: ATP-binding protein [Solirubrobacterales bacterium]|nr:ATP-binding protein [Solirubrobacterales bacterium]HMT05424.1 ATP-binding protein [Solirubrobacterales bacterium]
MPERTATGNGLPPCPFGRCDGGGWILEEDGTATRCECLEPRLEKARAAGINSTVPKRYRGVSFDRPPVTSIDPRTVQIVREWVDNIGTNLEDGEGIWFTGDVGTGKTTLAMLVSTEALREGHSVAIYSMPKLLARIKATFSASDGEQSYIDLIEQLSSVDLLHIDDLGAEKQTEWVLEQLYLLINERYERQGSVIVTTNLRQDELEEQIGVRTVSRLIEICGENQVPLFGEDARQKPRLRGE